MIRQELYIPEYDWIAHCYYAVDCYYTNEIANRLYSIGCRGENMNTAIRNMASCNLDQGICFSNPNRHESVLVIALTSSAAQFADSQGHEARHLTNHICEAFDIDLASEESCYIEGWIKRMQYPYVKGLICDHCRNHFN